MTKLSRRSFLLQSGAAGAALAAASPFLKASSASRAYGIQLYAVSADLGRDVPGTLRTLREIGYKFAEYYPFAGQTPQQFRKSLDDAGLKCPSAHVNFSTGDPAPQFEIAHTLGAQYAVSSMLMTTIAGGDQRHYGAHSDLTQDQFRRLAELANSIGAKARKAGLQYAYHNHNFEFIRFEDGRTGYQILLEETDPEFVKLELDCGWMAAAGYHPADYLRKYRGRYRMIHVKDSLPLKEPTTALFGPGRPTGTELGRGFIDYKPIFAAAEYCGVEYYLAEQEPPYTDMSPLAAARVNYEYMRSI